MATAQQQAAPARQAENRTLRVQSGDLGLAARVRGPSDKPTLVLVHGYPDNSGVWEPLIPTLVRKFRVVTYDVRGAGASDTPTGLSGYRLSLLMQDLHAVIDAVSPDRPVHVIAHDWGSIQCWEAATEPGAGKRIASFTSISGPCLDHVGHWFRDHLGTASLKDLRAAVRQFAHSWYILAFQLPWLAPMLWKWRLGKTWPALLERIEGIRADANPTQTEDGMKGVNLYRANMLPRLLRPRERYAQVPVQVIVPLRDNYVTPGMVESLEHWMPRLWRREIDAGHWFQFSHAQQVSEWIGEFVTHIEGGKTSDALTRARVA